MLKSRLFEFKKNGLKLLFVWQEEAVEDGAYSVMGACIKLRGQILHPPG